MLPTFNHQFFSHAAQKVFYFVPCTQFPAVDTGTATARRFPRFRGTDDGIPERKGSALQGPRVVSRTAGVPENAVEIRFFLQGQAFRAAPTAPIERNPTAPRLYKGSILHFEYICQSGKVIFGKIDKTALVAAAR
jgi:hypothetical protein